MKPKYKVIAHALDQVKVSSNPVEDNDAIYAELCQMISELDHEHFEWQRTGYSRTNNVVINEYGTNLVYCPSAVEINYGAKDLVVYTANHNGFWVAPILHLQGERFQEVMRLLFEKLIKWAGY